MVGETRANMNLVCQYDQILAKNNIFFLHDKTFEYIQRIIS